MVGPYDCLFVAVGGVLILLVGELLRWFIRTWRK